MSEAIAYAGGELSLQLVHQVLAEGFVLLAHDPHRLKSLFRRVDTLQWGLENDSQDSIAAAIDIVTTLGGGGGPRHVHFGELYPVTDDRELLPFVQISWTSSAEDVAGAYAGDIMHMRDIVHGADLKTCKVYRERFKGGLKQQGVLVQIISQKIEEAKALHIALSHVAHRDKGRMMQGGVLDVSIVEMGREINETDPHVMMLPSLALTLTVRCGASDVIRTPSRVSFDTWFQ